MVLDPVTCRTSWTRTATAAATRSGLVAEGSLKSRGGVLMTKVSVEKLRELAAYSGDPWIPQNPYFAHAEAYMDDLWKGLIRPFIYGCDFTHTIDLAAGHGRNSAKLATFARRLSIMDIQADNIAICKERFLGKPNTDFFVNNGFDL
jgi:hypothetical protein